MEKYGFVYIWFDRKHKRFYIGSHWGTEDDGYVCSSNWMRTSFKRRPHDFTYQLGKPRRKILSRVYTSRSDLLKEEQRWLDMVKFEETRNGGGDRYYNLNLNVCEAWHTHAETRKNVGERISRSLKGKKLSKERVEKLHGNSQSEEAKKKRSKSLKRAYAEGRRLPRKCKASDETRRKMSEAHRGRKHTEEVKKKMSEIAKMRFQSGA